MSNDCKVLSFIGGGGKTSLIYYFSKLLQSQKKSVIVTTTTKMYIPVKNQFDRILKQNDFDLSPIKHGDTVFIYKDVDFSSRKVIGVAEESVEQWKNLALADYILVEADGAKEKAIKGWAQHEPVIPKITDVVVSLVGLTILGEALTEENVHRVDRVCKNLHKGIGEIFDIDLLSKYIVGETGILAQSLSFETALCLNQRDCVDSKVLDKIIQSLLDEDRGIALYTSEIKKQKIDFKGGKNGDIFKRIGITQTK